MSLKFLQIQSNSAAMWAIDLYSAFVEDLATLCCFLAIQLIRLLPKYTLSPLVDRQPT